jgi:hypothetical protein
MTSHGVRTDLMPTALSITEYVNEFSPPGTTQNPLMPRYSCLMPLSALSTQNSGLSV